MNHEPLGRLTSCVPTKAKVRLTKEEMGRLEAYAKLKGYSKSEIIRDYIKRLPKLDGG